MVKSLEVIQDKEIKSLDITAVFNTYELYVKTGGPYRFYIHTEGFFNFLLEDFKSRFNIKEIDLTSISAFYKLSEFSANRDIEFDLQCNYIPMTEEDIETDRIETMINRLNSL